MFVTYKLSDKAFNKLQKKGLSEAALNDLAELKSRVFPSPEIFLNRVRKLPQAEEILKKEDELLKIANNILTYFKSDCQFSKL